jgi:predicted DNA-binding ribbon-helix-helix protein
MCQIYAGQPLEGYEPVTRRLRLNGHSTSIRLERSFWRVLDGMAAREGLSTPAFVSRLHDEVQGLHGEARNFASLLRCACLLEAGQAARPAPACVLAPASAPPSFALAAE